MAAKKPQPLTPRKAKAERTNQSKSASLADMMVNQPVGAAMTLHTLNQCKVVGLGDLRNVISTASERVVAGDMSGIEKMLVAQAIALDAMFYRLTEKALNSEYQQNLEGFLKLALRAQNQSRSTAETLSAIKNPPVVFAKQMNVAHNQQINNGPSGAGESQNQQNELLEKTHGQRLDARAKEATGGFDSGLEAMGKKHRAEVD